ALFLMDRGQAGRDFLPRPWRLASLLRKPVAPVLRQQPEQFGVADVAADEIALAQQSLAVETEPFQQPSRSGIAWIDVGFYPVQAERAEAPVQRQCCRFGAEAATPVVGAQRVADLGT